MGIFPSNSPQQQRMVFRTINYRCRNKQIWYPCKTLVAIDAFLWSYNLYRIDCHLQSTFYDGKTSFLQWQFGIDDFTIFLGDYCFPYPRAGSDRFSWTQMFAVIFICIEVYLVEVAKNKE